MKKPLFYITAACVLLLDQLIKYAVHALMRPHQSFPLIGEWFSFTYIKNSGAAFGMFSDKTISLAIVSAVLLILVFVYLAKSKKDDIVLHISLALVAGGSLGNLIDRVARGYVIDYLDVRYFSVFNLADMAINAGVALLIFKLLFKQKKEA